MSAEDLIYALTRKKPRRILHNQYLIQILFTAAISAPMLIAGTSFWLIFSFYPRLVAPAILAVWLLVSVMDVALRLCGIRQTRRQTSTRRLQN